jgi:hypothetical protein
MEPTDPEDPPMPRAHRPALATLAGALLLGLACAHRPAVLVPPRVDLAQWGAIGVVEFDGGRDADFAGLATDEFVQMLLDAQPGTRILELGSERKLLAEVGRDALDAEATRAIGERFGVDAFFTGALALGELRPNVRVGEAFTSVRAAANVDARLAAKLIEASSGALVWSRSARATANVARLGVPVGVGTPSVRIGDLSEAYGELVPLLVSDLSPDFHSTWQRP